MAALARRLLAKLGRQTHGEIKRHHDLMKYFALYLSFSVLACTHVGSIPGGEVGELDRELIDVVSFETGCPPRDIEIIDRPTSDRQTFAVEACGRQFEYERTDAVFHSTDSQL